LPPDETLRIQEWHIEESEALCGEVEQAVATLSLISAV
jgi:hypothetical protein